MINFATVQKQLESFSTIEDKEWNRGKQDIPTFHNGYGKHVASIELEIGRKLSDLIVKAKPKTIVEVGTNIGYSTAWLLLAGLQNGLEKLITFDIVEEPLRVWRALSLPEEKLQFVRSSVWDGKSHLPASIDFVFHDASHEVEQTQKELDTLTDIMSLGGVMTFHDIFLCRHMGVVVKEHFDKRTQNWHYEEIQEGRGLGVATRKL